MSNLRDLIAKANAKSPMRDSSSMSEENSFDELDNYIQDISTSSVPPNFNTGITKDGNQLQVGDPVVGIHRGQRMSGQCIAIQDDKAVVEWNDQS